MKNWQDDLFQGTLAPPGGRIEVLTLRPRPLVAYDVIRSAKLFICLNKLLIIIFVLIYWGC